MVITLHHPRADSVREYINDVISGQDGTLMSRLGELRENSRGRELSPMQVDNQELSRDSENELVCYWMQSKLII